MAESGSSSTAPVAEDEEAILARHRRETKELRGKVQALKKSILKGDKALKKEVTAQIAQLEQELQEQQERDLAAFRAQQSQPSTETQFPPSDNGEIEQLQGLVLQGEKEEVARGEVAGGEVAGGEVAGKASKMSKAQRRREKKAQKERDREQRIAENEAEAAADNPRARERERLTAILQPLGLVIKDIPSDGHCLYAAISDQLSLRLGLKDTVSELRTQCAKHIRSQSSDFLPFLTDSRTGDPFTEDQFEHYCTEIESTAAWGGHLEIRALSSVYKVPVKVYQATAPMLCIGEEYSSETALCLSYHHHEYGLGEHYNSLVPI